MNKKGFTLIELLGVLVILIAIFLLVFPSAQNIIIQTKEVTYQSQINTILSSAYDYTLKNSTYLPNRNKKKYVTLSNLKREGLIASQLKNPNTNKLFEDNLVISIENVGAGFKYSNKNSKLKGDYLYTVEEIKNSNLPSITLEGLTKKSNNNYVMLVNLNDEFNEPIYTSNSYKDEDLTDFVVKNIYNDNNIVEAIDTSRSNLYKINYSVVDSYGNSNLVILNVIVGDNEPPMINFDGNIEISKDISNYNLMRDVTCTDNSEICNITYEDNIVYGTPGKYIITYTAKDSNNNTTTKKRVLTIE